MPVGSLADGNYTWRVKAPKYLANGGVVALTGALVTSAEMGLMKTGDCNSDNVVGSVDFNILRPAFGRSIGQPGYDPRAEFTGDNLVSSQDFNLLRANFGIQGVPPISPLP